MNINDLDKVIAEYLKHFGKDELKKYFNKIIKIGEKKHATSKEKINSSSGRNK